MTKYTPKKIAAKLEDEAVAATSQTSPEQRGERNRGRPVLVRTAAEGTEAAPETESALRRVAEKIVALSKTSGAHAYDLGSTFAEAKAVVPEKAFGKWLGTFSDYTVRSAWNYITVHERLQDYREQMLSHAPVVFDETKSEGCLVGRAGKRKFPVENESCDRPEKRYCSFQSADTAN